MRAAASIFVFLLSAPWSLNAQEADTLAASAVYSVKELPVVKPAEEVYLPDAPAAPLQVADVLGVTPDRHMQLVAANDAGYIPAMQALNADKDEILRALVLFDDLMGKAHQRTPDGVFIHDLRFLMHVAPSIQQKNPAENGKIAYTVAGAERPV